MSPSPSSSSLSNSSTPRSGPGPRGMPPKPIHPLPQYAPYTRSTSRLPAAQRTAQPAPSSPLAVPASLRPAPPPPPPSLHSRHYSQNHHPQQQDEQQPQSHFARLASSRLGQKASGLWSSTHTYLASKDYSATAVARDLYSAAQGKLDGGSGGADAYSTGSGGKDKWSRERRARRKAEEIGQETITVFPGWAVTRARGEGSRSLGRWLKDKEKQKAEHALHDIHFLISGYASSLRPPERASRSQRAFMRLARAYAALPALPKTPSPSAPSSPSLTPTSPAPDRDLIDLEAEEDNDAGLLPPPSKPWVGAEHPELADRAKSLPFVPTLQALELGKGGAEAPAPGPPKARSTASPPGSPEAATTAAAAALPVPLAKLAQMHANLDARLQPFWSSTLTQRIVRVSVYPIWGRVVGPGELPPPPSDPILVKECQTNLQGYFSERITIRGEDVPRPLWARAEGDTSAPAELRVVVDLLPLPLPAVEPTPPSSIELERTPAFGAHSRNISAGSLSSLAGAAGAGAQRKMASETVHVPLTSDKGIRVISDLDDTVKRSDILGGVRAMFRNVFVNEEAEMVIPDMARWYQRMASQGVNSFHYVSNSPFELFAAITDFFRIAELPLGHFKLKYYGGGRTLLNGLWEPAGERKRGGVVEVLDEFKKSKFILIGDSGEQDLELYTAIARERPRQIIAVFIRDVSTPSSKPPSRRGTLVPPPAAAASSAAAATADPQQQRPTFRRTHSSPAGSPKPAIGDPHRAQISAEPEELVLPTSSFSSLSLPNPAAAPPLPPRKQQQQRSATSPTSPTSSSSSSSFTYPSSFFASDGDLLDAEADAAAERIEALTAVEIKAAKRVEVFRARVDKAQRDMPEGVMFRVFKHADEVTAETDRLFARQW